MELENAPNKPWKFVPYLRNITAAVKIGHIVDDVQLKVLFALAEIHDLNSSDLATTEQLSKMCGHTETEVIQALAGLTPEVTRKIAVEIERQSLPEPINGLKSGFRLKYASIIDWEEKKVSPTPEIAQQITPPKKTVKKITIRKKTSVDKKPKKPKAKIEKPIKKELFIDLEAPIKVEITLPLDGIYHIDRKKNKKMNQGIYLGIEDRHVKIVPPDDPRYLQWGDRIHPTGGRAHIIVQVVGQPRQVFIVEEKYFDPVPEDSEDDDASLNSCKAGE